MRVQERHLETVFGTVTVHRVGYGQEGTESLHSLDTELNLPVELYFLELRRRVAEEASKSSFDETVESIQRNTGGEVPKRQIEELVAHAAQSLPWTRSRDPATPEPRRPRPENKRVWASLEKSPAEPGNSAGKCLPCGRRHASQRYAPGPSLRQA